MCYLFICCGMNQKQNNLTFEVKKIDSSSKPLEETHVDEDAGGMELDVASVLGAVVGVVPLV